MTLSLLLVPGVAHTQPRAPVQVEVGSSYEAISGGPDWRDYWVRVRQPLGPRRAVYGTLLRSERFGVADNQVSVGAEYPLSDAWTANAEGSLSPTHSFLPRWSLGGNAHVALGGGWGARLGGGYSQYTNVTTTSQFGALERSWQRLGASYRLTANQVDGGPTGLSHRLAGSYRYATGSSITLSGTVGDQRTLFGPGDVRLAATRGVTLSGLHRVRPGLGLSYAVGWTDHGGVYTRNRVQIGFRVIP